MEIVLLLVAGIVIYAFIRAKTRMNNTGQIDAMRDVLHGKGQVPSWAGNEDRREEFVYAIQQLTVRKLVPLPYIQFLFEDKDYFGTFFKYAGALEKHGQSFAEQQLGVSEMIVKLWLKLSSSEQAEYMQAASSRSGA